MLYAVILFKATRKTVVAAAELTKAAAVELACEMYEASKHFRKQGTLAAAVSLMVVSNQDGRLLADGEVGLDDVLVEYQCGCV